MGVGTGLDWRDTKEQGCHRAVPFWGFPGGAWRGLRESGRIALREDERSRTAYWRAQTAIGGKEKRWISHTRGSDGGRHRFSGIPVDGYSREPDDAERKTEVAYAGARAAPAGGGTGCCHSCFGGCRSPEPGGATGCQASHRFIYLLGYHGCRKNGIGQGIGGIFVWRRGTNDSYRYVGIPGTPFGFPVDWSASGICRLWRRRTIDRSCAPETLFCYFAGWNRKSASGCL